MTREDGKVKMLFLSSLERHSKAVNAVRFAPDGKPSACCITDKHVVSGYNGDLCFSCLHQITFSYGLFLYRVTAGFRWRW